MRGPRPPHLPLAELEAILWEISTMLGSLPGVAGVKELDGRVGQCHTAIEACRRLDFSPPLLRALSAKVLEVETDALVLRRTSRAARLPKRTMLSSPGNAEREKRSRKRGGRRS